MDVSCTCYMLHAHAHAHAHGHAHVTCPWHMSMSHVHAAAARRRLPHAAAHCASRLSRQPPVQAWLLPSADERRAAVEREIDAYAQAAEVAWETAHAPDASATVKQAQQMAAASHYARLLQKANGSLGGNHVLVLLAQKRLAHVMTESGAARSCGNALPLWRA
eukprot:313620-Prymnesium_polylepis.1